MKENQIKILDFIIKVSTTIIACSTIIIGIYQYKINSEREFRKGLFNQQISIYLETSETVSKLANSSKGEIGTPIYENARNKFFELKYGKLYFLEDTIVETQFVNFTESLLRFERNDPKVTTEDLQFLSLKLNEAFRQSIHETWGIEYKLLKPKKDDIIK